MAEKNVALAIAQKTQESVLSKVKEFQENGELHFPANYRPENALKAAWLQIQQTVDRNKKPAIEVCAQVSIANAMLSTVVQGLNPDKKQCYYIVYGDQLVAQRSYFGSVCVAQSVNPNVQEFNAQVIYEGDEVAFEIRNGKKYVTSHKQKFQDINKANIIGAYCTVVQKDGDNYSVIMTMDEIKEAWKKSKNNPIDEKGELKPNSTHGQYTAEMACKTVIGRAAKHIINTSDDSNIVVEFAKQNDLDNAKAEAEDEIAENANNGDYIDVDCVEVDKATGELTEHAESMAEEA